MAILTAYCARGSLEDVLANEDLHLDNMFVSSLVTDILKVIYSSAVSVFKSNVLILGHDLSARQRNHFSWKSSVEQLSYR